MAHIFFICMEYFFLFIWQIISIYMATFFYFIYMTKYFDIYGKNVDLYVWQNTEFALIGPLHRAERVQSRLDERLPHRAPYVEGRVLDVHRRRHEQRVLPLRTYEQSHQCKQRIFPSSYGRIHEIALFRIVFRNI